MAHFFDFGEASLPALQQDQTVDDLAVPQLRGSCLCHGFHEDFDIPAELQETSQPETTQQEFNNDFSAWIPRYAKPDTPCDYCRSLGLECFIYASGTSKSCSPCNALFRSCSFSQPNAENNKMRSRTTLDTLDVVGEDEVRLFGGLTGKKPMRMLGHVGPIENDDADNAPKKGAAAARFPRSSIKILKDWMIAHFDHPYPTDEEKESLKQQTGLSISQISNWMANTRRRQKARTKRSASPSIRPSTEAIDIPAGRTWEELNPFERWKHSPPENEPAPMTAIAQAVESFKPPEPSSLSSSYTGTGRKIHSNGSTGSFSALRAPSTGSLETSGTHQSSGSLGTAWSHGSRNSLGSLNSLNSKKERRRRRRVPTKTPKHLDLSSAPRLFQCTFCTDRFKSKYDWSRHEKTLHLSLEKWICAPLGDVITCTSSGRQKCVFCDAMDPSKEHLETHNHRACEEKGLEARTFYRKDHLRQHLRLMHGCKMTASMESWKAEAQIIASRCGFCGTNFDKWQDRVDHLAKEFRNGANMKDWKGCRGLDAHIAAHVTNAMPPYLISNESKSPFPFSATSCASMTHHNSYLATKDLEFLIPSEKTNATTGVFIPHHMGDVSITDKSVSPTTVPSNTPANLSTSTSPTPHPNATCWEILTLRLGSFARQYIEQHGASGLTDEVLQQKARYILYDCDDPMDATAADNPEWLTLFKQAHGIDTTTPYPEVITRHDLYEDLGLNTNAVLDRTFNLKNFECADGGASFPSVIPYECALSGTLNMSRDLYRLSRQSSNAALPELSSASTSVSNIATATFPTLPNLDGPISELDCTVPGGLCLGEGDEFGFSTDTGTCARFKVSASGFPTSSLPTPIDEMPGTTASEPLLDHFALPTWDKLPEGFDFAATTAAPSASVPVSAGLGDMSFSGAEVIHGTMDEAQVQRWDDSDLPFNLDMDLDMDINASLDLLMGGS
ncbi:hypothetical protein EJ04DRAFT_456845 [Polyplosphaeria fusca]|uniref:Homeobox and C2H2 transcription factor n=1 Tax=Polyplosphaeria fusca TaxID=682080 RepID=A0A9P4R9G2_9PLEO|nr:hypothetical protein EJ04DRAFT_456845 [Polyplosphaeria fusca]